MSGNNAVLFLSKDSMTSPRLVKRFRERSTSSKSRAVVNASNLFRSRITNPKSSACFKMASLLGNSGVFPIVYKIACISSGFAFLKWNIGRLFIVEYLKK